MKNKIFLINFFLILFGLILGILTVEMVLELNSWVYKRLFLENNYSKDRINNNKYTFLFIGDSWIEGGEAPPNKAFPEQFINLLSDKKYSFINAGYSSSNSSYAVLKLIEYITKNKFDIVFVLTGFNNGWNVDDAQKIDQIAFGMYGWKSIGDSPVSKKIFLKMGLKRIGRLFAIYNYNKTLIKPTENFKHKDSNYVKMFNSLIDRTDFMNFTEETWTRIRKVLLRHYRLAKDYDEFYRVIKLTYDNQSYLAEEFLKSKNMWNPELIKGLDLERSKDKYHNASWEIAERDLKLIATICREHKIKLIFLTYPEKKLDSLSDINKIIRKVAMDEKAILIDQANIFRDIFKSDMERLEMFANHHPNDKGYALMAKNIADFLSNPEFFKK